MENSEKQRKTENISEKQKTYQKTDSKTAKNSEKQKTEMENCFSWFLDEHAALDLPQNTAYAAHKTESMRH